jgi:hypothetical protein
VQLTRLTIKLSNLQVGDLNCGLIIFEELLLHFQAKVVEFAVRNWVFLVDAVKLEAAN